MKNTLKKKMIVSLCSVSIAATSLFGSLTACTDQSSYNNFDQYSVVKMTDNYVLHKNSMIKNEGGYYQACTDCNLSIEWISTFNKPQGPVFVYDNDDENSFLHVPCAGSVELYMGKSLKELKNNHIEYTDVCEECFPDGIEAE